jgi:predicted Zn-dependent protease with MMP-like domain
VKAELARLIKGSAVNTTLMPGKQPAEFDAVVLDALNHVAPKTHHPAEKRLLIGIQNEHGEVYRVIKIVGLYDFLDLIGKFRDLGFTDEFAQHAGDKEGFDAILSLPAKS